MARGWFKEPRRHGLSARGIKTAVDKKPVMKVPLKNETHYTLDYRGYTYAEAELTLRTGNLNKRREERFKRIQELIDKINKSKFRNNGIRDRAWAGRIMAQRMKYKQLHSDLWRNLSDNKDSDNLFDKQTTDPILPIVYVDTYYLRGIHGNPTFQSKIDVLKKLLERGGTLEDMPIVCLRDDETVLCEGNHRVEALHELGYKSVPVQIQDGWD